MAAPVTTLDDAIERFRPKAEQMRALGVQRLALLVSVARGRPRPESDVDGRLRFAAGGKTYGRFLGLAELLEEALGRRVERITTESLSPVVGIRSWLRREMSFEPADEFQR